MTNREVARILRGTAQLLAVALLLTLPVCLRGEDLKEIERKLKPEYEGKVLTLRHFNAGSELQFDPLGSLVTGGPPGPWTLNGMIEVTDLALDENGLRVDGKRLFLAYDQREQKWRNVPSGEKVSVTLKLPPPPLTENAVKFFLNNVFLSSKEKLADVAPAHWKGFLGGRFQARCAPAPGETPQAIGPPITPQTAASAQPQSIQFNYPPVAQEAGIEGTVLLWARINESRKVESPEIVCPIGMGLDESAVEVVKQWTVDVPRRGAHSLPTRTLVEVVFRLK